MPSLVLRDHPERGLCDCGTVQRTLSEKAVAGRGSLSRAGFAAHIAVSRPVNSKDRDRDHYGS